jgi:site-specific DNA-methyltransferase (adenine-specific)
MGKQWDTGETAFATEFWAECLRVLKPGGHVVSFSGTRTFHRMVCAIEDAGFEVRDQIGWTFGSGFPKSHNAGNGWGTALKPAWEPICLARKPLSEKTVAANLRSARHRGD